MWPFQKTINSCDKAKREDALTLEVEYMYFESSKLNWNDFQIYCYIFFSYLGYESIYQNFFFENSKLFLLMQLLQ